MTLTLYLWEQFKYKFTWNVKSHHLFHVNIKTFSYYNIKSTAYIINSYYETHFSSVLQLYYCNIVLIRKLCSQMIKFFFPSESTTFKVLNIQALLCFKTVVSYFLYCDINLTI